MNVPDSSVLELLRCPVTHTNLKMLEASELENLNEQIRLGKVSDRMESPVTEELTSGLINADRNLAWSIRGNIMQLIADEGIVLDNITL